MFNIYLFDTLKNKLLCVHLLACILEKKKLNIIRFRASILFHIFNTSVLYSFIGLYSNNFLNLLILV